MNRIQSLLRRSPLTFKSKLSLKYFSTNSQTPTNIPSFLQNICAKNRVVLVVENNYRHNNLFAVELLNFYRVPFQTFDLSSSATSTSTISAIYGDQDLPQILIDGEPLGSTEAIEQWHESGCLQKILAKKGLINNFLAI